MGLPAVNEHLRNYLLMNRVKTMQKFSITVFILVLSFNAAAASFDCGKTTTLIEMEICSDNNLSELDGLLIHLAFAHFFNPPGFFMPLH